MGDNRVMIARGRLAYGTEALTRVLVYGLIRHVGRVFN